jgi:hypothetical protein
VVARTNPRPSPLRNLPRRMTALEVAKRMMMKLRR